MPVGHSIKGVTQHTTWIGMQGGRGGKDLPLARSPGSRRTGIAFTHSGNGSADAAAGNGGRSEGSWFGNGLDDGGTEHC